MILSVPIYVLKRRAREMARRNGIALTTAQNRLARLEGYQSWSHLAAADADTGRAARLLGQLKQGTLVLLGARPGQGKTLLGLELLAEATTQGRPAAIFTLEYTHAEVAAHLAEVSPATPPTAIAIDTSDLMSAAHVTHKLAAMPKGGVAVIDYLQLMDQRRNTPPLADQVETLKGLANLRQITLISLSQIDRNYDATVKPVPDQDDLRLPNPLDLTAFDQMVFLQDGTLRVKAA